MQGQLNNEAEFAFLMVCKPWRQAISVPWTENSSPFCSDTTLFNSIAIVVCSSTPVAMRVGTQGDNAAVQEFLNDAAVAIDVMRSLSSTQQGKQWDTRCGPLADASMRRW